MKEAEKIPLTGFPHYPSEEMLARAEAFRKMLATRRSVRDFSDRSVPANVITEAVMTAASAPSGANKQPWHFEIVGDRGIKRRIRLAAEQEEREFYAGRASDEWLQDLAPLGTDAEKPFLETAPWLIAIFEQRYGLDEQGRRTRHYYTKESVGLATGFLIAALHNAGLATLTHTPSPMNFLNEILERPRNEKPFLLLVVGFPAEGCSVPVITKKIPDRVYRLREDPA